MPSPPYAKLLVSVDGGGTTSGAITVTNGATIQFSAESTAFWTTALCQIFSFPSGFSVPAGWTDAGGGIYQYLGIGPPPSFALPAAPTWGKFLPRLTVNDGRSNGVVDPTLKDETTGLSILSPTGLRDLAYQETNQFDATKKWVGDMQQNLRQLDTFAGAAPSNNIALIYAVNAGYVLP